MFQANVHIHALICIHGHVNSHLNHTYCLTQTRFFGNWHTVVTHLCDTVCGFLKKMFQKTFSVVMVLPNVIDIKYTIWRTSIQNFHARVVHVHHNKRPQRPVGRHSVLFCFAANYNLGYVKPTQAMLSLASNGVHSFVFVVYWHGVRRWGSEGPGGRKRRLAYTDVNLQPAWLINKEQRDNTHRRRVALYSRLMTVLCVAKFVFPPV